MGYYIKLEVGEMTYEEADIRETYERTISNNHRRPTHSEVKYFEEVDFSKVWVVYEVVEYSPEIK